MYVYLVNLKWKKMREEKFEILDEIKEIKTDENIQSTLSIAISEEGDNNLEKIPISKSSC